MDKLLIYDCEIINLIPYQGNGQQGTGNRDNPQYNYCKGWHDFQNMGISVIGTWRNFDLITVLGKNYIIPLPWGKYEAFVNYQGKRECFRKFYKLYCVCDQAKPATA